MSEQAFGREAVEIQQGYTPYKPDKEQAETFGPGLAGTDAAAKALQDARSEATGEPTGHPEPIVATIPKPDGVEKVAITAEDAAALRKEQRDIAREDREAFDQLNLAMEVAQARALPKSEPLDLPDPNAKPDAEKPKAEKETVSETDAQPQPGKPEGANAGELSEQEIAKQILARPEVREAIEQEVNETGRVRMAYAQGLAETQNLAMSLVFSTVPELQGIEPQNINGALQLLAARDPARYEAVKGPLNLAMAIKQRSDALQQENEQRRVREFKTWATEQDQAFAGKFPVFDDPEKGPQARAQVMNYLTKKIGLPADRLERLWTNDLFRDAMSQEIIWDAVQSHVARERLKNITPETVSVSVTRKPGGAQRPGTSQGHSRDNSEEVGRLRKSLPTLRGSASISGAVALLHAQRAQRGR